MQNNCVATSADLIPATDPHLSAMFNTNMGQLILTGWSRGTHTGIMDQ